MQAPTFKTISLLQARASSTPQARLPPDCRFTCDRRPARSPASPTDTLVRPLTSAHMSMEESLDCWSQSRTQSSSYPTVPGRVLKPNVTRTTGNNDHNMPSSQLSTTPEMPVTSPSISGSPAVSIAPISTIPPFTTPTNYGDIQGLLQMLSDFLNQLLGFILKFFV